MQSGLLHPYALSGQGFFHGSQDWAFVSSMNMVIFRPMSRSRLNHSGFC